MPHMKLTQIYGLDNTEVPFVLPIDADVASVLEDLDKILLLV